MTGRRRSARYVLSEPIDGSLHVREEVAIERWEDDEIVVLSSAPSRSDETLTLELPGPDPRHVLVRVEESKPVVSPNRPLRHRIRLSVLSASRSGHGEQG